MFPLRDVIPSRTTPIVTIAFIVVNALVFLYEVTLDPGDLERFIRAYGLVPAAFSATSVVTSMFMHGGWAHMLGNNLYLWIFGDNVEDRLGHARFTAFYLLCGVAAALAQTATNTSSAIPMVGASGAIAGIMGAYFLLFPHSRVLTLLPFPFLDVVEVPAIYFLGVWFLLQLVSGVGSLGARTTQEIGGIAFWAHAAGFAAGFLLVLVFRKPERQRVEWWEA
jgi:membrane associated rhomboid family serine protease